MNQTDVCLTLVALAWNEAAHLGPCFDSLQPLVKLTGAKTLILLDQAADYATIKVARRVADTVATSRFVTFSRQRNRALDLATTEWVFFIDPDERLTQPLAREIAHAIVRNECSALRVARRNFLFGHEVRHSGWWPDYQTRLLRRARVRYDEARPVHEYPVVRGETCTLLNPMVHFNYDTWRQFIAKQRSYASMEAMALYEGGYRARTRSFVGQPLREFKRRYIDYEGYRDGLLGLALAVAMSAYRGEIYRQLRDIERASTE